MGAKAASSSVSRLLRSVALVQGGYYAVTGFWPLASVETFQLITGRKRDIWLVKTAGSLIGIIGCVLALAGWRRAVTPETLLLGAGSAAGLAAVDLVYVRRRVIGRIYLADAAAEIGLVALWGAGTLTRRRSRR